MNTNGDKSKLNNFIVQGGILAFAGVLVRVLGLIKRIPLTYIIGDLGNSYFGAAFDIYSIILTLSAYGIPIAVSKLISARVSKGQFRNADKIFKCSLAFSLFVGTIASTLVFVFSEQLSNSLNEPMSFMALRVLAPTILFVGVMGVFRGFFQGMGSMIPTACSQLIEQVFVVAVSLTCAYFFSKKGEQLGPFFHNDNLKAAYGACGATFGYLIGSIVGLVFLVLLYKAYKPKFQKKIYRDPSHIIEGTGEVFKTLLLTITPIVFASTVNNISNYVDHFVHNAVMVKKGLEDIMSINWGIYTGKYSVLINVPIALGTAMGASTVPTISGLMKRKEYIVCSEKIAKVIRSTMIIVIPCAVGLFALAPSVMWTLFSSTNEIASTLLRIGSLGVIFFSLSTLSNSILQGMSRLSKPITHGLIALLIHVTIMTSLLFLTDLNIYAVALSNNFFSLFICIFNLFSISKILDYRQEFVKTFFMPGIAALVMGVVIFILDKIFMRNGFSRPLTILNIIIGAGVYFATLILIKGIAREDLEAIPGGTRVYAVLRKLHIMS